jgi:single-strand DNA-binding protein
VGRGRKEKLMASFNKVILIGNLVADPELKATPAGVQVTSFRIAVGRRFKQGEGQQQTDFIDVVAWRSTAEFISKYFTKGKPILICGALQTRTWTDNNNQKRYAVEVVAEEASFVGSRGEQDGGKVNAYPTAQTPSVDVQESFTEVSNDEDLPF